MLRRFFFLFSKSEKICLTWLLVGAVLAALIEMLIAAAILQFVAIAVSPDNILHSATVSKLSSLLEISNVNSLLLFVGGSIFGLLLLGNSFSAFLTWQTMRFCHRKGKRLSCDLFKSYLSQPYLFFLERHNADLMKNILSEVDRVVSGIFINGLQCFSRLIVSVSLFLVLLWIEPLLACLVMGVLGSAYGLVYYGLRRKLLEAGKAATDTHQKRYRLVQETLSGVKELRLLGREETFLARYEELTGTYARMEALNQLSPSLIKYAVEIIVFGTPLLMALFWVMKEELQQFVPFLGLYAFAGYRLMPAMQQIFLGMTLFRYHQAALEMICKERQLPHFEEKKPLSRLPLKDTLIVDQIGYHYPNAKRAALKDLSFTIHARTTVGFVGASGAGKSTLVHVLLGLLHPEGKLLVDGQVIVGERKTAWQRNVGYVPQQLFLVHGSVASNIALGISPEAIDREALYEAARLAHVHDFIVEELPEGYETLLGEQGMRLSGGQRQRIAIARALYHDPDLLVFDEATSALDGFTEKVVMEAIQTLAKRKTIILVAHRFNTVKHCDTIYVLQEGTLVGEGSYGALLKTNASFQQLACAGTG